MKTKIIALLIIGIGVVYTYSKFNVIWTGEKIDLKELGTINPSKGSRTHEFFNEDDWLIITGEEQRLHWKESGYNLPAVDFKATFIILSNRKIKALYREDGCDECTGVSNGFALYDYFNSEKGTYYIYSMSAIWLSQAVG